MSSDCALPRKGRPWRRASSGWRRRGSCSFDSGSKRGHSVALEIQYLPAFGEYLLGPAAKGRAESRADCVRPKVTPDLLMTRFHAWDIAREQIDRVAAGRGAGLRMPIHGHIERSHMHEGILGVEDGGHRP